IENWNRIAKQGVEFAARITPEIIGIHVEPDGQSELLRLEWQRYVEPAFREAGHPPPQLLFLVSPYRFVIRPLVQFILDLSQKHPQRRIIVVIPELMDGAWYEYFLHNQRGRLLEWTLLVHGNDRIFTVNAPFYLSRPTTRRK